MPNDLRQKTAEKTFKKPFFQKGWGSWAKAVLAFWACVLLWGSTRTATAETVGIEVIESFNIDRIAGLLTIPVIVDGRAHLFAVDTGATLSVFDPALQSAFDWTSRIVDLPGIGPQSVWECSRALVGSRKVPLECRAICVDLGKLRKASGQDVWGILGMDFLRCHVVQIDFDEARLAFLKGSRGVSGEKIRLEYNRADVPTVALSLPGIGPRQFIIDTGFVGFGSGTLPAATLKSISRGSLFAGTTRYMTIHALVEGRVSVLTEQSLRGFRQSDPVYFEGTCNLVGMGFLSRFKVTFDFLDGAVYVQQGKRFGKVCPANRLGIDFSVEDGVPIFRDVATGGLAWRSGLRDGDRLLGVDGRETGEMSIAEIGDCICRAQTGMRLRIACPPPRPEREIVVADDSTDGNQPSTENAQR